MNTTEQAEVFESEGLAYAPDAVLLGYCLNDAEDDRSAVRRRSADWAARRKRAAPLWTRSAFASFVYGRVGGVFENRLRVRSYFAHYADDASGWKARSKKGEVTGWGFKDPDGPITSVSIKGGKSIAVKGKGTLGHDLATQPPSVNVVLEIGAHRYCLDFGGTPKFKANKKYLATKASAPTACLVIL